jgi:anti-sigma B factor antagonist
MIIIQPKVDHLDAGNVKDFREGMRPFLDSHDRIVLNMSELSFVDSAGVGTLISCLRISKEKNGYFFLCELKRPVRALFDLMRMHRVFEVFNTLEEAQTALKSAN